jgi:predicted nucleic acid-binding protein
MIDETLFGFIRFGGSGFQRNKHQTSLGIDEKATRIFISTLTLAETKIVLQRKRKQNIINQNEYVTTIAAIDASIRAKVMILEPLPEESFEEAVEIGDQTPVLLRTMDALHIAMVVRLGTELATFDKNQAAVTREKKIKVHTEIP